FVGNVPQFEREAPHGTANVEGTSVAGMRYRQQALLANTFVKSQQVFRDKHKWAKVFCLAVMKKEILVQVAPSLIEICLHVVGPLTWPRALRNLSAGNFLSGELRDCLCASKRCSD